MTRLFSHDISSCTNTPAPAMLGIASSRSTMRLADIFVVLVLAAEHELVRRAGGRPVDLFVDPVTLIRLVLALNHLAVAGAPLMRVLAPVESWQLAQVLPSRRL